MRLAILLVGSFLASAAIAQPVPVTVQPNTTIDGTDETEGRACRHPPGWPGSRPRAVDGDTVCHRGKSWRLYPIDTPESDGCEAALAAQAKQTLQELLDQAMDHGGLVFKSMAKDRYGRELAIITRRGDGLSLADVMLRRQNPQLARPYYGEGPHPWCQPDK